MSTYEFCQTSSPLHLWDSLTCSLNRWWGRQLWYRQPKLCCWAGENHTGNRKLHSGDADCNNIHSVWNLLDSSSAVLKSVSLWLFPYTRCLFLLKVVIQRQHRVKLKRRNEDDIFPFLTIWASLYLVAAPASDCSWDSTFAKLYTPILYSVHYNGSLWLPGLCFPLFLAFWSVTGPHYHSSHCRLFSVVSF